MKSDQERLEDYMFRTHSRAELREWGNALRFFRFCRAAGGHANDGDTLEAALGFRDLDELHALCRGLGFSLTPLPPDEPQPVVGQSYSGADFGRFRTPIDDYRLWEQPGRKELAGVSVFLWVHAGKLRLSLSGDDDPYEVTEADVEKAKRLEVLLEPLAQAIVDPPNDSDRCFHPGRYPRFFAGASSLG